MKFGNFKRRQSAKAWQGLRRAEQAHVYQLKGSDAELCLPYRGWLTHVECTVFFRGRMKERPERLATPEEVMAGIRKVHLNLPDGRCAFDATGRLWYWSNWFSSGVKPFVHVEWAGHEGAFQGRVQLFIHTGYNAWRRDDPVVPITDALRNDELAWLQLWTEPGFYGIEFYAVHCVLSSLDPPGPEAYKIVYPYGLLYPYFECVEMDFETEGRKDLELPGKTSLFRTVMVALTKKHQMPYPELIGEVTLKGPHRDCDVMFLEVSQQNGAARCYDWPRILENTCGLDLHSWKSGENALDIHTRCSGYVQILHHCVSLEP